MKKYITSKSKTFKEGFYVDVVAKWLVENMETEFVMNEPNKALIRSKQKYKITITNLK